MYCIENHYYSIDIKFKSNENSFDFKKELPYEILNYSEIKSQAEKTAEHLSIIFQINHLNSINYLIKNSWNLEKATNDLVSYLDLSSQNSSKYKCDRNNFNYKVCDICLKPNEELISLDCIHHFCTTCINTYLKNSISQASDLSFRNCPIAGCKHKVPLYLVQLLLKASDEQAFEKFIISSYVDSQSHIKWCPGKNCTNAAITLQNNTKDILCSCGHFWCFDCGEVSHRPASCETLVNFKKKIDKKASLAWIEENTQKCPRCKINIERIEGCFRMTCNYSCVFYWNNDEFLSNYHSNQSLSWNNDEFLSNYHSNQSLSLINETNDTNANSIFLKFKTARSVYFFRSYSCYVESLEQYKKSFWKYEKFFVVIGYNYAKI